MNIFLLVISNGLIFSWIYHHAPSNTQQAITLPIVYSNTSYVVELSWNSVSGSHWQNPPYCKDKTTTNMTITSGSNFSGQYFGIFICGY